MRLRRQHARPQHETVVTLIDVVFFLLVFFLLVGRFDATAPFAVSPPISENGSTLPGGGATVSISGDGKMALNGEERELGAIVLQLRDVAAGVDRPLLVRVNADAEAPVRYVLSFVDAIESDLTNVDVVLIVTRTRT